jgi:hypothetical protein
MNHKGVEFCIIPTEDSDIWRWQFQIGEELFSGTVRTRLAEMADRRTRQKIDRMLREPKQ